jgi:hypothetical protein
MLVFGTQNCISEFILGYKKISTYYYIVEEELEIIQLRT